MAWRRLGLVYRPENQGPNHHPLLATHAALPVACTLGGDLVRVFYSGRDASNRSSVGTLVLRLGDTPRIEALGAEPVLTPGGLGAFDDAGVGVGCLVTAPEGDRLYYMGWNVGGSVPWRNAIGVAVGDAANGRWERLSAGPVMDRDTVDAFSLSYPWVLRLQPQDWRMWYGTHLAWGADKADMHHAIRGARSTDGIHWQRDPAVLLGPEGNEIAVVRPSVSAGPLGGEMWFAARAEGPYRLVHARSTDLLHWRRTSEPPLVAEPGSWEAGAVCYPAVLEAAGRRWLFYNGAGYGASGFGLAVWEA